MPRPNRITRPVPAHLVKPILYATPAYGRTCNNANDLRTMWENGKDFKIVGGPYFSIRDTAVLKQRYGMIEIECYTGVCIHINLGD